MRRIKHQLPEYVADRRFRISDFLSGIGVVGAFLAVITITDLNVGESPVAATMAATDHFNNQNTATENRPGMSNCTTWGNAV